MGDIATVSGSQVGSNQRNQQQQGKSADVEDVSPVGSDLVQEIGKDVLVSKGAATRLSPFPADVRPKTMAIAVMMVMTTIFVSFFVSTLTKNCPYHDEVSATGLFVNFPMSRFENRRAAAHNIASTN